MWHNEQLQQSCKYMIHLQLFSIKSGVKDTVNHACICMYYYMVQCIVIKHILHQRMQAALSSRCLRHQ